MQEYLIGQSSTQRDHGDSAQLTAPDARPLSSENSQNVESYQYCNLAERILHNHPAGDPTPSRADIQMTQAIIDVAKPLGISVHDHIIVGKEGHASFKGLRLI